ncbi:MAG: DUF2306 domain-containing protein [Bacteroidota bacterium]
MKNKAVPALALLVVVGFTLLMANLTLPYFSFKTDVDFLLTKQAVLHKTIWRWAFYWHISVSALVLLIGGFQFVQYIIDHFPKNHRLLGKIYVFSLLIICAPSGLIMAFYANGGIWAKISFVFVSIFWWCFTYKAFIEIRKRNIESHKAFMTRSYALTLSAITLRLYVFALPFIINWHGREMYILVAWMSWIPNLIVAELIIWSKKNWARA